MANKKIVGMLQPFNVEQMLFVYEDGNKIDMISTTVDDFVNDACALIHQYQIKEFQMAGPRRYTENFGQQIQNRQLTEYNNSTLEIKYI